MLISTAPFIAGWRVQETKGHVFGLVVRSRGLGGNVMAGHAVMKVFAGFAGVMGIASIVPIAAIAAIYGLELLVAVVQAYVFTILTCVYLRDAVGEAHH